jgi:lipopolysaccharide heptosyltransferase I
MPPAGEPRFLIVRLGALGDLMHTLPAVAALRSGFPACQLDWVVESRWSALVELVTVVDNVIPWRRGVSGALACRRQLRQRNYSCAIDFQGLYKSALVARLSGARRRIGFDSKFAREPGASRFYTERVASTGRHVAEMNLSLTVAAGAPWTEILAWPLRLPEQVPSAILQLMEREDLSDYCVVSPGGGWRSKCWPPERYGELCADLWRRMSVRTVVNAGPGEEHLARSVIASAAPAKPVLFSPTLSELAVLLGRARLVVAADTGPLHLAAALGTPVVALFGPTDPARNGPLLKGTVLRNASDAETTYKRGNNYSHSMLALSVEQVSAAAEREWSARR